MTRLRLSCGADHYLFILPRAFAVRTLDSGPLRDAGAGGGRARWAVGRCPHTGYTPQYCWTPTGRRDHFMEARGWRHIHPPAPQRHFTYLTLTGALLRLLPRCNHLLRIRQLVGGHSTLCRMCWARSAGPNTTSLRMDSAPTFSTSPLHRAGKLPCGSLPTSNRGALRSGAGQQARRWWAGMDGMHAALNALYSWAAAGASGGLRRAGSRSPHYTAPCHTHAHTHTTHYHYTLPAFTTTHAHTPPHTFATHTTHLLGQPSHLHTEAPRWDSGGRQWPIQAAFPTTSMPPMILLPPLFATARCSHIPRCTRSTPTYAGAD